MKLETTTGITIFYRFIAIVFGPWIIGYIGYTAFLDVKQDVEIADYMLMPFGITVISLLLYAYMLYTSFFGQSAV